MTRARILKLAQPAPQPQPQRELTPKAACITRDLPWLPDAPQPVRRAARRPLRAMSLPAIRWPRADLSALAPLAAAAQRAFARISAWQPAAAVPAAGPTRPAEPAPMSLGKRAALLLAIITVPAMAAPGDLALFAAPEPAPLTPDPLALAAARALPFERPGMSFPGSAFFFLEDPPAGALVALPTADPLDTGAEGGRELGEFIAVGPAAKPFFSAGTGISHARAQECLAQAVWYEAASESEAGQRAVAQVVLNRVAHPNWPASVCGVVYQGAQRSTGCQFTFTCDGSLARRPSGASWARAQRIAAAALAGEVYAPVGHATHYHTLWVNPYWARTLDHVGTIGAHRFYRNRGAGGEKAAFTMAYAGFEPGVSGRSAAAASEPFVPAAITSAHPFANSGRLIADSAPTKAADKAKGKGKDKTKTPATDPGAGAFQGAGEVRPEFANVGQWKADPAAAQ
jgi:hypothetical protein